VASYVPSTNVDASMRVDPISEAAAERDVPGVGIIGRCQLTSGFDSVPCY